MSYRETSTGTGREAHMLRVGRVFLVGLAGPENRCAGHATRSEIR